MMSSIRTTTAKMKRNAVGKTFASPPSKTDEVDKQFIQEGLSRVAINTISKLLYLDIRHLSGLPFFQATSGRPLNFSGNPTITYNILPLCRYFYLIFVRHRFMITLPVSCFITGRLSGSLSVDQLVHILTITFCYPIHDRTKHFIMSYRYRYR